MKKILLAIIAVTMVFVGCKHKTVSAQSQDQTKVQNGMEATVYMTRDISPEALVKIYQALGVDAKAVWQ